MSYIRISAFDTLEKARLQFDDSTSLEHSGDTPTHEDYCKTFNGGFRERSGDFYQEESIQQSYGTRNINLANKDLRKLKNNLIIGSFQSHPENVQAYCNSESIQQLIKNY